MGAEEKKRGATNNRLSYNLQSNHLNLSKSSYDKENIATIQRYINC